MADVDVQSTASSSTPPKEPPKEPTKELPKKPQQADAVAESAEQAANSATHEAAADASLQAANADDLPRFLSEPVEPSFWEDVRDSLPPWLDEIIAIALLIFGVLSFLALFDPSEAVVALAWAEIITTLFGLGSVLIAGGFVLLGAILLLPKAGVVIRFPPARVLATEITFLCMLAVLHVSVGDDELRALARDGEGGGIIGWGLSVLPYWFFGRWPTLIFFALILVVSFAYILGVRWRHILAWFETTADNLLDLADWLAGTRRGKLEIATPALTPEERRDMLLAGQRTLLMRIRPNYEDLPPSLRPGAKEAAEQAGDGLADSDDTEEKADLSAHPLFTAPDGELAVDFNLIGERTGRKTEDGHEIVRRPDGREKRYFAISQMKESNKVGRRDKSLPNLDDFQDIPLTLPDENEINRTVVLIENTLLEFDIDIDVIDVQVGPTVTRFAIQPYRSKKDGTVERTRLNKIASYTSDLSMALSAKRLRLEIPVPGTNYLGLEVPNQNPSTVTLRSVFESRTFYDLLHKDSSSPLTIPLGRDVAGRPLGIDLAKMPHLLIAGTTGSGKSVFIGAAAVALMLNNPPDKVKLVMLDPKMVELSRFNGLPHLLGPVETDTERIIGVLKWCTREMDRRYKLLEEHAVRNIDNYNAKFGARRRGRDYMPHVVIMIDEIGDLMLSRPEETETAITRLAQMARAVGMHLVVATQRPSVDVITGLIKANFPGRMSFHVASSVDSRVILDAPGAETLLGHGDMLYLAPDASGPRRVQGCFVSDDEVRSIVQHWTTWQHERITEGKHEQQRVGPWERGLTRREFLAETDPMLEEVIEFVVETQEASASLIQRRMGLGYPRAARLLDMLEELGVVGDPVGGGRARRVVIPRGEDPFKRIIDKRMKPTKQEPSAADTTAETETRLSES